jgi:hypothetical protein
LGLFEAQYPAHLYLCLRFTSPLTERRAKLEAERIATPYS